MEDSSTWRADVDSGMLQGWGCDPAKPPAVAAAQTRHYASSSAAAGGSDGATAGDAGGTGSGAGGSSRDRADLLFAGDDEEPAAAAEEEDEEDDEEDDADMLAAVDDEVRANITALKALLSDNAAFYEACEAAVALAADTPGDSASASLIPGYPAEASAGAAVAGVSRPQLRSKEALQRAMNSICERCGIEEFDEDEAKDMFDGHPMDSGVFYQVAREYFQSLVRTLTMLVANDIGPDGAGMDEEHAAQVELALGQ
eukprot:TRINITY_DN45828_c0_g1_i1.p2 TRINITY_DN45828_c0_g1~~TRINITY_DN45828_c0_g1_i1.p2  ORF type:complete len:256 (-),score=87.35 TRINITY_DN45828_c0_g1_i1:6-773(-)